MKLIGVIVALAMVVARPAHASPRTDLESPSQQTRDAAAAKQRKLFKPTPRSKLQHLVKQIKKPGMTKAKTLALLRPYRPTSEGAGAGGGGETILYRIDDSWLLECGFSDRGDGKVLDARLIENVRNVFVEPAKDFTGVWTTYYADGQPSFEITYTAGKQGTVKRL
jgi:hypothetical protein